MRASRRTSHGVAAPLLQFAALLALLARTSAETSTTSDSAASPSATGMSPVISAASGAAYVTDCMAQVRVARRRRPLLQRVLQRSVLRADAPPPIARSTRRLR